MEWEGDFSLVEHELYGEYHSEVNVEWQVSSEHNDHKSQVQAYEDQPFAWQQNLSLGEQGFGDDFHFDFNAERQESLAEQRFARLEYEASLEEEASCDHDAYVRQLQSDTLFPMHDGNISSASLLDGQAQAGQLGLINIELDCLANVATAEESVADSPIGEHVVPSANGLQALRKQSRMVLEEWILENPGLLYPDRPTKVMLAGKTGLTFRQVNTWFSNYRQRIVKPLLRTTSPNNNEANINGIEQQFNDEALQREYAFDDSTLRRRDYIYPSEEVSAPSTPRATLTTSSFGFSPDERTRLPQDADLLNQVLDYETALSKSVVVAFWIRSLPPDDAYDYKIEHFSGCIIGTQDSEAFETGEDGGKDTCDSFWDYGPDLTTANIMLRFFQKAGLSLKRQMSPVAEVAPSKITKTHSTHSNRSSNCALSVGRISRASSGASMYSYSSRGACRGRKISVHKVANSSATSIKSEEIFTCALCHQNFTRAFSLKRHTQSVHLGENTWVCRNVAETGLPAGLKPCCDVLPDELLCLCGKPCQSCGHEMLTCWTRDTNQRTFFRLDYFQRHLRETHKLWSIVPELDMRNFESKTEGTLCD